MGIEINKVYNENCLRTMARMPNEIIDLTITSPPYDNLRTYKGYEFDFEPIARELYRVTKPGGVVVWVVGDATIKGSETGTSFTHALYFKQIGFNLETMIWEKTGSGALGSNKFYAQNFEYMFILTKGFPKTHNLITDRENKVKQGKVKVNGALGVDGKPKTIRQVERKAYGKRTNIWRMDTQKNSKHPAPFPEQLAEDHIASWSNPNDLVYDPMAGSGTTLKMAWANGRNYIGSEIAEEYCKIAEARIFEIN